MFLIKKCINTKTLQRVKNPVLQSIATIDLFIGEMYDFS